MNHREILIDREKEMTAWLLPLRLWCRSSGGSKKELLGNGGREPRMRIWMSFYLSPVVGVGHVDQGIILGQQVVPIDHVHHKLVIEPVLGDDKLLQVVDVKDP